MKFKTRFHEFVEAWKVSATFNKIDNIVSNHYRKKLQNDKFTILCSNCVGGTLYHRLGQQFLSPTINMWLFQPEFVEFVLHLDWYLNCELNFIQSKYDHPVALLKGNGKEIPDIKLYFNHDKEEEEAREKWERRKKRIVKENMYIMLYNLDGITVEQIKRLETVNCKNKVIFTSKPLPEISWSFYIKPIMSHHYPYNYLEKDAFGVRYLEKKFDFVSFFNDVPVESMRRK